MFYKEINHIIECIYRRPDMRCLHGSVT